MKKGLLCTSFLCMSLYGQSDKAGHFKLDRQTVQVTLGFETGVNNALPAGWGGGPDGTISADNQVAHAGKWSARLERKPDNIGTFSTITAPLSIDFEGREIELSGFLRLRKVSGFAALWMREDGNGQTLAFTNMESRQLHGTSDWADYAIKLPLVPEATNLYIGVLISGTGIVWADDLQLRVDNSPIAKAPSMRARPSTVLDRDHAFDNSSHIALERLTAVQIGNLAALGRVWGFLKYHHTVVTSGQRHWDYDLFRIMPAILAATDRAQGNATLVRWIDSLGVVADCKPCAHLDPLSVEVRPDLGWIEDKAALGAPLCERLLHIYANRGHGSQFYVSTVRSVGNPSFDHELSYPSIQFPDPGFQILALFRFWNAMQYWAPDRQAANENWAAVLKDFIPKVALARDKNAYQLAMMALIAKAHDTHANLWSSLQVRPPVGECALPVGIRFIDDQAVVSSFGTKTAAASSQLELGDIIEELDGVPVANQVATWTPLYADSNQAARLRDMGRALTKRACGPAALQIRRDDRVLQISSDRLPLAGISTLWTHDLPGDTFRMLSKDVAYLKLSAVKAADVPGYIQQASGTKGLIVDIRNYPSEFVVFALGSLLATEHTPFARFTKPDLANPGAFHFADAAALDPATPHYSGKVVILVDEISQSQAEYTAMALRSTPHATVVGSMTAGADGNISTIPLPGGLSTGISGLGVYYPDKSPTQRVGIRRDVEAKPTLQGIREGRDEVLEAGIRQILGASASAKEVETLARP